MKAQGIRSLIASVSSVLAIGLMVSLGAPTNNLTAVPMAPVGQPVEAFSVSTATPTLAPLPTAQKALSARHGSDEGLVAPDGSIVPEEAPGEDTTILAVPSVVPTVPIPSVPPIAVPSGSGALLSMPLQGQKTSRFGMRFHPIRHVWKLHSGLDLAAACGTPIGAAAAGTVTKAGWAGGNGIQVQVDHGQIAGHHVVTTYNHLSAIGVSVGQKVAAHQGVGRVGNTGYSTGCHLHFEVIADGKFTNPEPWLNGSSVVVDAAGMMAGQPGAPSSSLLTPTNSTTSTTSAVPASAAATTSSSSATPSPVTSTPTATTTPTVSPAPSATETAGPSAAASPTPCVTPSVKPDEVPDDDPSPCVSVTPSPTACVTPSENPDEVPDGNPSPCTSATPSATPSGGDSSTPLDPTKDPVNTPTPTDPSAQATSTGGLSSTEPVIPPVTEEATHKTSTTQASASKVESTPGE